jgi:tol-pal system protein YbgF
MTKNRYKDNFLKFRWIIIFCSAVFFISSCVYDKELAYLNDQNRVLNKRVTRLEETINQKLKDELESSLKSIHTRQAESSVEIEQLKSELAKISGRVEDNELIIKRTVERDLGEQDNQKGDLARLMERLNYLEARLRHQQEYLGLEPFEIKKDQEQKAVGVVEPKERAEEAKVVEKAPKSNELELYETSMSFFREGNFEQAMDGFRDFLKKYPKSDRADNAQFWIGECYMSLRQYEQAILAYQEVIKKFPKGNKVPNAMLRQAVAFLEIKDKTSSRLLLKKIIKQFPKSSEAKIAQKKLETIK